MVNIGIIHENLHFLLTALKDLKIKQQHYVAEFMAWSTEEGSRHTSQKRSHLTGHREKGTPGREKEPAQSLDVGNACLWKSRGER